MTDGQTVVTDLKGYVVRATTLLVTFVLLLSSSAFAADDLLIDDFEGKTYGDWKVEGKAFGPGPAQGTLPRQMQVSGFLGKGLVNSFFEGDRTKGTLTSAPLKIERPYINFLLGGGRHPGETCINLLVDDKIVRSTSGPNDKPGGSEQLEWQSWDVSELIGKQAVIQIVDQHAGGWGHINVDHIVQSDKRKAAEPAIRTLAVTQRYLHLPVKTGAPKRRVKLLVDGQSVREFDIELAPADADFIAYADVGRWKGKQVTIDAGRFVDSDKVLANIVQSDQQPEGSGLYAEKHRPQFHFTTRRGWINDPNGLMHHKGEWHLFYQHNPYGWNWGNMHWGHAVSTDLIHWKELGDAIHPWSDVTGAAFSGSGLVDAKNTAGFKTAEEDVLIAALTDTGSGESIAYSNDRGRSWTMYSGNPVVEHQGRDPKIIRHAPTDRWIMAVYTQLDKKRYIGFYSSSDLKSWNLESRIEGFYECPDLFELPVDGDAGNSKWVLYAADGKYVLGDFDGKTFTPEHEGKHTLWHGNFYAAQTYSDAPDNRRIQIGWGRGITFPGMPFNQQMTIPVELTLRSTAEGVRMFAQPVKELETLRDKTTRLTDVALDDETRSVDAPGQLFDIDVEITPDTAQQVGLRIAGREVTYDVARQEIVAPQKVSAPLTDGKLQLRILADRSSIEIFAGDGRIAISKGALASGEEQGVAVFARGGTARVGRVTVHTLKSAWE